MCDIKYEDVFCSGCGWEIRIPANYKYEPLCRSCIKAERAERKALGKYFLKKEIRDYEKSKESVTDKFLERLENP